MYEKTIDELKSSFQPMMDLAELNRKTFEKLAATQSEYLADCLNTSIKQVRELADVKDATSVAELQFKYLKEFEQKLNLTAEKNLSAFNELRDAIAKMLTEGCAEGFEKYAESLAAMEELTPFAESTPKAAPEAPKKKAPARAAAKPAAKKAAAPAPKKPAAKKAAPKKAAAPAPKKPAAKPAEAPKAAEPKAAAQPAAAKPAAEAAKPAATASAKPSAS